MNIHRYLLLQVLHFRTWSNGFFFQFLSWWSFYGYIVHRASNRQLTTMVTTTTTRFSLEISIQLASLLLLWLVSCYRWAAAVAYSIFQPWHHERSCQRLTWGYSAKDGFHQRVLRGGCSVQLSGRLTACSTIANIEIVFLLLVFSSRLEIYGHPWIFQNFAK